MKKKLSYFAWLLFAVYALLLIWIILFKMKFSFGELYKVRKINLVPFYYDNGKDTPLHLRECIGNFLIFIPFGIYISVLCHKMSFALKFFMIALFSMGLEALQYVLSIGITDITDVITNTLGGAAGILMYKLSAGIFRSETRADSIIIIIAAVITLEITGLLALMIFSK